MADLTRTDRGQIILVAAFALAVTFIALALVINGAIFSENLSTRGETTGASDALTYRHQVQTSVTNVTTAINANETTDLLGSANRSIENVSRQGGFQQAGQGRFVTVDFDEDDGTTRAFLTNNATAEYTNATGTTDWTLANDTEEIRDAQFNVTAVDAEDEQNATTFRVDDATSGNHWQVSVMNKSLLVVASFKYNLTVRNQAGVISTCEFTPADSDFVINLTAEQVETDLTTECTSTLDSSNLDYTGYSTKNISFQRGENVTGNYSIELENGEVAPENFDDTSPVADAWIETLNVTYVYESDRVTYNTTVPVHPGETG